MVLFFRYFQKIVFVHKSKYNNISRKMALFWDHFEKVVLFLMYPEITFYEKRSFLRSLLKNRLLKNSRKLYLYTLKKSFFAYMYIRKYRHFEKNEVIFEIILEQKNVFCRKCQKFKAMVLFFKYFPKKVFVHKSKNMNISRKMTLFWDQFSSFLLIYPKISAFPEKRHFL